MQRHPASQPGRLADADMWERIRRAREAERSSGTGLTSLLRLAGDVILLCKDLAVDPRVPVQAKLVTGLAGAYLISPIDLVPDWVPVLGQMDDLGVVVLAFRQLCGLAGYDLVRELWRGSDEGLALVLTLAGVQE